MLKNDVAAFRFACSVAKLRQQEAQIIEGKVSVVPSGHESVEQFFHSAHVARILAVSRR